ncbi:MAG: YeeE/YedE family protein [Roseovarius sp.]|nr:YeeE/YedE family protein [Roseovarius sp.]
MLHALPDATLAALIGGLGGIFLGLAARLGRFCTLGAIEDHLYQGDTTRIRMWGLAIASAGMMSFGLAGIGAFDPAMSVYYQIGFSPFAHILGGLLFGYGMALAGNCGFGALARVGGGDLRAFVIVLVMGIAAYVMLSGPLAQMRLNLVQATTWPASNPSYADLLASALGISPVVAGFGLALMLGIAALWSRSFLARPSAVIWALVVGLAITSGWAGTFWIAQHGFGIQPVISHTFTAPLGESLLFVMTSSAGGLSFGIGSVAGVLMGAFIGSLFKGHFRWEACDDPRELKRQLWGATLMGFGAVLALGCTIGQGISAFAIMSLGAPLTFASIYLGAALGLRQLITGFGPLINRGE